MFRSHTIPIALVTFPVLLAAAAGAAIRRSLNPRPRSLRRPWERWALPRPWAPSQPNLATEDELTSVPGITAEAAAAVVGGRPYLRAADLHAVLSGAIGDEAALAAYGSLWLPINLNDVTNDEILLIPGVGDRMATSSRSTGRTSTWASSAWRSASTWTRKRSSGLRSTSTSRLT